MASLSSIITLLTALGAGLVAGVFFAFSVFVMQALAVLPAAQGIAAMQSINFVILSSAFMPVFFGTALASLGLAVVAVLRWDRPGSAYLLIGGLAYVLGAIVVTIAFNVPRNDALAQATPAFDPEAWRAWVQGWMAWNHVRGVASTIAAIAFVLAALKMRSAA